MDTTKNRIKNLCHTFSLPETDWLPAGVVELLTYLQSDPSAAMKGDVLYLQVGARSVFVQLLTLFPERKEIIAERPLVIALDSVFDLGSDLFQHGKLLSYAAGHGIYADGMWDINEILLNAPDNLNREMIADLPDGINITTIIDEQELPPAVSPAGHDGRIFKNILAIWPKLYFIETASGGAEAKQLELIPFASENLVLDVSQRHKIFSFPAGGKYNLADDDQSLLIRIYEQSFKDSDLEMNQDPSLVLEYESKLDHIDAVIELCFDFPTQSLELEFSTTSSSSHTHYMLREWQNQIQVGYDTVKVFPFIDAQLLIDYGQHLERGRPHKLPDINKTVYYKALTLLNILCFEK